MGAVCDLLEGGVSPLAVECQEDAVSDRFLQMIVLFGVLLYIVKFFMSIVNLQKFVLTEWLAETMTLFKYLTID